MSNEEIVKEIQKGINPIHNMELLYTNNRPLILQSVKKYSSYAEIDDLMQEAYFGLYEAVQRYEDMHEVKFMSYATHWINQAVSRYIENYCKSIRIPVHMHWRMQQYKKVINYYKVQFHREPTDKELCRHLKIDFKGLKSVKRAISQLNQIESLDGQIQGQEDGNMTLGDIISDKVDLEEDIIESMMQERIKKELWQIVEKNTLPIENKVINARFRNNLTLEKTGQELGITREAVRQWENKGLRKLRFPRVSREIINKFEVNNARVYRSGWSRFNQDLTSITERVALKNIELEKEVRHQCRGFSS